MDQQLIAVGERVRSRLPAGLSQRSLAASVEMTPDALSRALNGQRGFSSIELAKLAEALGVDLHWLITGNEDPLRVDIAARHAWDPMRARRVNPGREDDNEVLQKVIAVYRETYPDGSPTAVKVPANPADLRARLGDGFVHRIAEQLESVFAIDVIRLPELSTDYSLTIGGRSVILLVSTPNWFRNNWSAAHELGHLALGHHAGSAVDAANERPADEFAAELLLPEDQMRAIEWSQQTGADLAQFLWDTGVSTSALRHRLRTLRLQASDDGTALLNQSTQGLLSDHLESIVEPAARFSRIVQREAESSGRTFPLRLVSDLSRQVRAGQADPSALAWVLDAPIDEIAFPDPDHELASREYEELLASRPTAAEWQDRIAADPAQASSQ